MKSAKWLNFASIVTWLCITLFYCYQLVLRILPNIIMPDMIEKFAVTASDFGVFASMYYIGYIIVQIPIGLFLLSVSPKYIMPCFVAFTAFGLVPIIYSDNWYFVLIGRALTGIGSSAAIVGALHLFPILYKKNFVKVLGYTVFFATITAVFASDPLSALVANQGIESTVKGLFAIGIAIAILSFFAIPKEDQNTSVENVEQYDNNISAFDSLKQILVNYKLLTASFFAGLMVGPLEGFADAWGSVSLIQLYGLSKFDADSTILGVLLGLCIGVLLLPYIADKFGKIYTIIIACCIGVVVLFALLLTNSVPKNLLYCLCIAIGLTCSYQVLVIAKVATYVKIQNAGIASICANMIIMFFGSFYHNMIGNILDFNWDGVIVDGVRVYSNTALIYALSIIPIGALVAFAGFLAIAVFEKFSRRKAKIKSII